MCGTSFNTFLMDQVDIRLSRTQYEQCSAFHESCFQDIMMVDAHIYQLLIGTATRCLTLRERAGRCQYSIFSVMKALMIY